MSGVHILFRFGVCFVCSCVFIQLLCMIRYVSFNSDMYGLCVWTCVYEHSKCIGLSCSFICVIGDRVNCLSGVCVVCVVGW